MGQGPSLAVQGRPITPEAIEDLANTLNDIAELLRRGQADLQGGFYAIAGLTGPVVTLQINMDMTVGAPMDADQHHSFQDCLDAPDAAISYFRDTGEGYCHLCKKWHAEAVEKERHARGGLNRPAYGPQPGRAGGLQA